MTNDILVQWAAEHATLLWAPFGVSIVVSLVGIAILPVVVVRIPADYFSHRRPPVLPWQTLHPVLRIVALAAKNLLGALLIAGGIVMLVTPGQGVLSILAGLALMDLPGKRRLERKIVAWPRVWSALNRLRARYGRPPLERPMEEE